MTLTLQKDIAPFELRQVNQDLLDFKIKTFREQVKELFPYQKVYDNHCIYNYHKIKDIESICTDLLSFVKKFENEPFVKTKILSAACLVKELLHNVVPEALSAQGRITQADATYIIDAQLYYGDGFGETGKISYNLFNSCSPLIKEYRYLYDIPCLSDKLPFDPEKNPNGLGKPTVIDARAAVFAQMVLPDTASAVQVSPKDSITVPSNAINEQVPVPESETPLKAEVPPMGVSHSPRHPILVLWDRTQAWVARVELLKPIAKGFNIIQHSLVQPLLNMAAKRPAKNPRPATEATPSRLNL